MLPQAINSERVVDSWTQEIVNSVSDAKVQDLFNNIAKGKLVGGFDDRSDVAIRAIPWKNSSERFFVDIGFYVGGTSDEEIEVLDSPVHSERTTLKVRDVVSAVHLIGRVSWVLSEHTQNSDFGKCVNHSKERKDHLLKEDFQKSSPLLEQVVTGTHPQFAVISKADFDKRQYIGASVWIEGIDIKEDEELAIYGNGIGMNDWKKPIPMHHTSSDPHDRWVATIRGKQATGEYKLALLKSDGSFLLEQGETRKFKDINVNERGNYIHQLSPPAFEEWEMISP
jgi:hypothetical protein